MKFYKGIDYILKQKLNISIENNKDVLHENDSFCRRDFTGIWELGI